MAREVSRKESVARRKPRWLAFAALAALSLAALPAIASEEAEAVERDYVTAPEAPASQSWEAADAKSAGCVSCHTTSDRKTMHATPAVVLGCTDCHGGNAGVMAPAGVSSAPIAEHHEEGGEHGEEEGGRKYEGPYQSAIEEAHVLPRYPTRWTSSANPQRSYTWLNNESREYIRFINPGDLRIARESCGACHAPIIQASERSLMANAAMFWGAASYNNGVLPYKHSILGEAYTKESLSGAVPAGIELDENMKKHGILPQINPLPSWETVPPADVFRVFERGGRNLGQILAEIGNPGDTGATQRLEEPGRPDLRQSNRGPGTGLRVSIPVLNIHKTRLNDPFLWFMGTNDNPGDYRSSGCSGCHVVYANDRDPRHSAVWAKYGNEGMSAQADPTIPKGESGHPIKHAFSRQIPTSQCMICHMHQPNMFINSMLGYTMWDYESDAAAMWPAQQKYPTNDEMHEILERNPEEAAIRGKWGDPKFSKAVAEMNPQLKDIQFADYHGHGWNFRSIFARDRKGNLLDAKREQISDDDPNKFDKAVHLSSVHVDLGMQCVDCHFAQDNHGDGYMKAEVMGAVEIQCQDCHGTVDDYPNLKTTGPAAAKRGLNLKLIRNPDGKRRFEWVDGRLVQRSATTPGLEWTMSLVKDTADPVSPAYNAKATRAHAMSRNTKTLEFGKGVAKDQRAHSEDTMVCYTCHSSWTTSCGGCHLPIQANWRTEKHKYEGGFTRNFATYNPQVARDDMYFLGKHGVIKNYKIAPVRSSSALVLSSQNVNRERIYIQQAPLSAAGYSSQAFAPHYPHTERRTETKTCTDCHLSKANDNNAIMAQLLLLGTKFIDFVGYNSWVGGDGEVTAVRVTEFDEPQAVVGSYLQRYAYPDYYKQHQEKGRQLGESFRHRAGTANCIQLRGEYLYVAEGTHGMRVYDVASIANKAFSAKAITAPFSPLGQDTRIKSPNATCVALATTQPVATFKNDGSEKTAPLMQGENLEQPMHPIYKYAYITDAQEGLIVTNVDILADQEPRNNFFERALTWNEGGVLTGASHLYVAGTWFYVSTPNGVVVLDMNDPLAPRQVSTIPIADPIAVQVQFRYAFVTAKDGLHVVDVTHPDRPRVVESAFVPLNDPHKLHVARTYAYVANGSDGLAIIDVTNPERPQLYQMFNADGALNDARDVVVGTTNASLFAYVADGKNGLKVVQLTSPESQPKFYGFSPDPKPELISFFPTKRPALALSRGLERDRAVDETGHQIAIFGRIGSRPFNAEEMARLYLDADGNPWYVDDAVDGPNGIRSEPVRWRANKIWDVQVSPEEMERERGKPMDEMHAPGENTHDDMSAPHDEAGAHEGGESVGATGTPSSPEIDRTRPGTRTN